MKKQESKTTVIKTTKKELDRLQAEKAAADKAFFEYRTSYNKQHNVKPGNVINEIIDLYRAGASNKEIVEAGYNKNTVNRQVNFFKKGIEKEATTIAKML